MNKQLLSTLLELVGFAAVVAAGVLVFVPLGLLLFGVACVFVGFQLGGDE